MTIKFTDAAEYFVGEPQQIDAFEYLQANTPPEVVKEFARRYRNKPTTTAKNTLPEEGVKLIKEFEGCHLFAYYDPLTGGLPVTIGWGSTRNTNGAPFSITEKISQHEADNLLYDQLKKEYLPPLTKIPHWNEMNENQQGALLSFAYNNGADFYGHPRYTTITRVLKEKKWDEVPKALELYRNPGSTVEAGLLRRRKAEGALWKSGLV
jgi:lysozyme